MLHKINFMQQPHSLGGGQCVCRVGEPRVVVFSEECSRNAVPGGKIMNMPEAYSSAGVSEQFHLISFSTPCPLSFALQAGNL